MKQLIVLLVALSFISISCNQKKETKESKETASVNQEALLKTKGLELLTQNCLVCHKNTKTQFEIIAPPMEAVKQRYKKQYTNKEEFVNALVNWAKEPDAIKSLMHGAIEEFDVMPNLEVNEDDFMKIANYIYDNELEKPTWFKEYYTE